MKKSLQIIVVICIVMLAPLNVLAQVDNEAKYKIATNDIPDWPKGPKIKANTGVLMEMDTGEVLYDKGMHELRYPASITKILTALVAVENSTPEEEVVFTATALEGMYLGSNIDMQEGEILTMEQCILILMMKSANEVANQIAEHIGGTQQEFAEMMNARAAEIGCLNTHFTNASGMPDDNHYTTAYDMALIFREALKNERFRSIYDTMDYTIPPTNRNPEPRHIQHKHVMFLTFAEQHYKGCIGGKTGATDAAQSTLVTGVERKNGKFITVVMRAGDHLICCDDTKKLLGYGYKKFDKLNAEEGSLLVPIGTTEADLEIEFGAPDDENMAEKTYSYNGYLLGTMVGEAPEATPTPEATATPTPSPIDEEAIAALQESISQPNKTLQMVIIVMGTLIGLGIVLIIVGAVKNKKKRKNRR